MLIACILAIMVNGEFEDHIITGQVIKAYPTYYIADFSNSVSGLNGTGNYKRFLVPGDRCSVVQYRK